MIPILIYSVIIIVVVLNYLVQYMIIPKAFMFPIHRNFNKTFPLLEVSKTWNTDKIPKIIHQTAPSETEKWNPIWFKCQQSWKEKFPDFEYKMWTDEDLDEFIRTKFEWFYPTYKSYDKNIKRIDSARYFILYEYGGIYADMDYECINKFDHLLPDGKVSICESPYINHPIRNEKYENSLMASPQKHPFWNLVFNNLEENINAWTVVWATGPNIVKEAIDDSSPEMWNGLFFEKFTRGDENGYSRHYNTGSWI